jgi:hypothetical protein
MDVIFRVCAYPGVDLGTWWDMYECYCMVSEKLAFSGIISTLVHFFAPLTAGCHITDSSQAHDVGWNNLCTRALLPYITLNIIFCFPETWDPASGMTDDKDYRQMKVYQYMVHECTLSGMTSEVATHPHRQFFGIEDGQFHRYSGALGGGTRGTRSYLYGSVSFEHFLNCDKPTESRPRRCDVPQVQRILHSKGLPMELVLEIMDLAEYTPSPGRLWVPHHPFHRDNWDELEKYLKFCWQVLVRCDMMASALGMVIPWQELVSGALRELFDCCTGRWWTRYGRDCDETVNTYTFL